MNERLVSPEEMTRMLEDAGITPGDLRNWRRDHGVRVVRGAVWASDVEAAIDAMKPEHWRRRHE